MATVAVLGVVIFAVFLFDRGGGGTTSAPRAAAPVQPRPQRTSETAVAPVPGFPAGVELAGASHIADDLNRAGGTIRRDLEILNEVFDTWQTNFPRQGNPVGENAEITAALTGGNSVHFGFIPPGHPAINRQGELCDRWGTPFRFHQLSGSQMEIRSAGADRQFGTADDAAFAPAALVAAPR
jgi:hypothetical protein